MIQAQETVKLTPQELNLSYTKSLVVVNPQAEKNKFIYDFH